MNFEENICVVFHAVNDLRLEHRPVRLPDDDEVLLKVDSMGICGSDLHLLNHGRTIPGSVVIGHESAGTVIEVGENVNHLLPGDKVAIEPRRGCAQCYSCKAGRYNLCIDSKFGGTVRPKGSMVSYFTNSAQFCHKYLLRSSVGFHVFCFRLPPHVSLEEGALLEPLAVAVHACKRGMVAGSEVLVTGAGSIGLLTMAVCKVFGATKVIITDVVKCRLDKAKEMGADLTLQVDSKEPEDAIVKKIVHLLGRPPRTSFECVGLQSTTSTVIKATANGGTVVLVGVGEKSTIEVSMSDILVREVDVRGSYVYAHDYPTAIDMVANGRIDVKPLITHHYKIGDVNKAFDELRKGDGDAIKILIHPN